MFISQRTKPRREVRRSNSGRSYTAFLFGLIAFSSALSIFLNRTFAVLLVAFRLDARTSVTGFFGFFFFGVTPIL
jgi:hypothetical protein